MNQEKEAIGSLIDVEKWTDFEEFIKSIYSKCSNVLHVEKNYRAKGKSGRLREVDVLVKFGVDPHVLSLGIECKYWDKKVDGDVVDVVVGKKEDLGIDKFAVVTTIGYERGAELYAKSKGIDIFVIRPVTDDDFGYTGKVVKFQFESYGSRPIDIVAALTVITESRKSDEIIELIKKKLSNLTFPEKTENQDRSIDLFRYQQTTLPNGSLHILRGQFVDNLAAIIQKAWSTQNQNAYEGKEFSLSHKILFKEPTAVFINGVIPVPIREVNFRIQYLRHDWSFEVDRSAKYPAILENVIERAVTPIKVSNDVENRKMFVMEKTAPIVPVDLSKKPADAVGRDGVKMKYLNRQPMDIPSSNNGVSYELIEIAGKGEWKKISN